MSIELIRTEVTKLMREVPFRPFFILMENGDRVMIEHPENIAFHAGTPGERAGSREFRALTNGLWYFLVSYSRCKAGNVSHSVRVQT